MSETWIPAEDPAHDVLAADMFAMPAADPVLHHGPVRPPEDPTGIVEPHDVLAAEEFPMPAGGPPETVGLMRGSGAQSPLLLAVMLLTVLLVLRRRRSRV
jgi:hypothetical protein